MRISLLLSILPATSTLASASQDKDFDHFRQSLNDAQLIERSLFSRDLPPCTPCPKRKRQNGLEGNDATDTTMFDPSMADDLNGYGQDDDIESTMELQSDRIYPANYIPPLCNRRGYNCMYLAKGVEFIKGGLSKPVGHWRLADGGVASQIWAWRYWQSTLLFTGTGGTCTTYPAHCTIYTCCKGTMFAHIYDDNVDVRGDGDTSNNAHLYCQCDYKLDSDQYFGFI